VNKKYINNNICTIAPAPINKNIFAFSNSLIKYCQRGCRST
jgi:hypothetical protein